ncbi:hypothetical protein [Helicobacter pylori]|nr:hypothetical protein [Helicobacter pylori]
MKRLASGERIIASSKVDGLGAINKLLETKKGFVENLNKPNPTTKKLNKD